MLLVRPTVSARCKASVIQRRHYMPKGGCARPLYGCKGIISQANQNARALDCEGRHRLAGAARRKIQAIQRNKTNASMGGTGSAFVRIGFACVSFHVACEADCISSLESGSLRRLALTDRESVLLGSSADVTGIRALGGNLRTTARDVGWGPGRRSLASMRAMNVVKDAKNASSSQTLRTRRHYNT